MWSRIEYMEWQALMPQIGFILFATAFLIVVWRVFRADKHDLDKASRMPLEDENSNAL